jgi:DNA ligase-1
MRDFARLYAELDETTSTSRKLAALQGYFARAAPQDAACVSRRRWPPGRATGPCRSATERAGLDEWLFDEAITPWATWPKPSP